MAPLSIRLNRPRNPGEAGMSAVFTWEGVSVCGEMRKSGTLQSDEPIEEPIEAYERWHE